MIKIIKKIDIIVAIIIFTICIGVVVITMRSKTYHIGYEIAELKRKEKNLREKQIELQSELAEVQRSVRDKLLAEKDKQGKPKFLLPDQRYVIQTTHKDEGTK